MTAQLDRQISLGEIFRAIIRFWWFPFASFVLCCTIAIVMIILTTPVYRAEALVKPARSMNAMAGAGSVLAQMGGLASLVGLSDSADELTTEAIAVMHSRKFIMNFIRKTNLMPVLFSKEWDPAKRDWKAGLKQKPTELDGYYYFVNHVFDAFKDRKTGFVKIQVDWTDRRVASDWVNQLTELVNDEMRAKAMQETSETLAYLNIEHGKTESIPVRAAIFSMIESQLKAKTMAAVRKQYAFEILDPAIPPDAKTVLRPRRLLYMAAALLFGSLVGVLGAVVLNSRRRNTIVADALPAA